MIANEAKTMALPPTLGLVNTGGRPSLSVEEAARVRAKMRELLNERFDGNITALAKALRRKQPSISNVLSSEKNSPSYETARRVAELAGMHVSRLLEPDIDSSAVKFEPVDRYPSRAAAIEAARRLRFDEGVLSDVAQMRLEWPGDPGLAFWAQQIEARASLRRVAPAPSEPPPSGHDVGAIERRRRKRNKE